MELQGFDTLPSTAWQQVLKVFLKLLFWAKFRLVR